MDDALGARVRRASAAVVAARMAAALLPPAREPTRVGAVTLMPHQQDAEWLVRQSIARWGGALLADPVGTGKTWVALAVARDYREVIVIAPAALRARWLEALERAGRARAFQSLESLSRSGVSDVGGDALLIVDEAHHVRNPGTRRFDALARLAWGHPVLLLTATPVHNRPQDLHALCSLFLGEAAARLPATALARLVCRRVDTGPLGLPHVEPPQWLRVDDDPAMLALLRNLPPPLPPSDGGTAAALGTIALLRQWASSEAALLAALERRLTIGVAMEARLMQGGTLSRADLRQWIVETGTVQLGLPLPDAALGPQLATDVEHVRAHLEGLRGAREHLIRRGSLDGARLAHLRAILDAALPGRVVCFSHSADTARALFRALAPSYRAALLGGQETRVSSGIVSRAEVLEQFTAHPHRMASRAMRLDVLVATDVMSEGVDLHDAGTIIHLDLPWTMARLEQRIGRLRRLGATHAWVRQFAFEPAGGAAGLLRMLDRLSRKAGLAKRLIGDDPLSLALPTKRHALTISPSDEAARLHEALRSWGGQRATDDDVEDADIHVASARSANVSAHELLALVDIGDGPALVLRTGSDVTMDHSRIVRCMRHISLDAPLHTPCAGEVRRLQLNLRALRSWCQREAEQVGLLRADHGETRKRVLRRLHAVRHGKSRHEQRAVAAALARVFDVVMRSTGAGAERWLAQWLEDHPPERIDVPCLDDLRMVLEPRARATTPARPVRMLAAILVTPGTTGLSQESPA